jgi:uncharacterized membrane protein YdbT with pleckstrin-like domain
MGGTSTETDSSVEHRAETDGIDLMQGESVLQNRRPGWALWWKQITFAALVLLFAVSAEAFVPGLAIAGIIFGVVVLSRMQSRYIVTDERVKSKVGIISKAAREYRISDVQSISSSQSIFERIFGHGTLTFRTASNDEISWRSVPEYKDVTNTLREEQRKYESRS